MRLEHHLVGGYVRYISPYIIIIIIIIIIIMMECLKLCTSCVCFREAKELDIRYYILGIRD